MHRPAVGHGEIATRTARARDPDPISSRGQTHLQTKSNERTSPHESHLGVARGTGPRVRRYPCATNPPRHGPWPRARRSYSSSRDDPAALPADLFPVQVRIDDLVHPDTPVVARAQALLTDRAFAGHVRDRRARWQCAERDAPELVESMDGGLVQLALRASCFARQRGGGYARASLSQAGAAPQRQGCAAPQ